MRKRVHWPARGIEKGEREASTIIHSLLLLLLLLVRFVSFQTGEAKGKAEWPIHLMSLSQFCTIQVREMSAVYMYCIGRTRKVISVPACMKKKVL